MFKVLLFILAVFEIISSHHLRFQSDLSKNFQHLGHFLVGGSFHISIFGRLGNNSLNKYPILGNHNRWLVQEDWLFAHFLYLQFGASIKPRSGLNAVRFDLVGPDDEIEVVLLQEFRQGLRSEHRQAAWRQVEWCGREAEPECQGNEWPCQSGPSPLSSQIHLL